MMPSLSMRSGALAGFCAALLGVASGAAAQDALPTPPSDSVLKNDGSIAQRRRLTDAYSVQFLGNNAAEVHVGPAVRSRELDGALPQDVRQYLAADPVAASRLPPRNERSGDAAMLLVAQALLPGIAAPFLLAPVTLGIILASGWWTAGTLGTPLPVPAAAVGLVSSGLIILGLASLPVFAGLVAIPAISGWQSLVSGQQLMAQEAEAVALFNQRLAARIEAQGPRAQPAAPVAAAPVALTVPYTFALHDDAQCVDPGALVAALAARVPAAQLEGRTVTVEVQRVEGALEVRVGMDGGVEKHRALPALRLPSDGCTRVPALVASLLAPPPAVMEDPAAAPVTDTPLR